MSDTRTRQRAMPDLHSRVTIPDGRAGTVVATRSKRTAGHETPLGFKVRLDGAERAGPHPWYVAGQLDVVSAS